MAGKISADCRLSRIIAISKNTANSRLTVNMLGWNTAAVLHNTQ